jgi:hypothetical protein
VTVDFVKLHTTFHDHRKTAQLDAFAVGIWTLCLSWCGRQETDGLVPRMVVHRQGGEQGLEAASRLVSAGLWEVTGDDWRFHDWCVHQEDREALARRRAQWRERQERHRKNPRPATRGAVTRDQRDRSRVNHASVTRLEVEGEVDIESPNGLSSRAVAETGPIARVFDEYRAASGRSGRYVLSAKRRRIVAEALRQYPLDDVLDACRGWQHDPWPERPLHNGIEVLLRDSAHIEKFRDLWRHGAPAIRAPASSVDTQVEAILRGEWR